MITALDMNNGTLKWQVPHGDTPDAVRNSPLLKGMTIPKTGQQGIVGVVLTKSLVIVGDPQVTAAPDRPRGAMLRAYDQQTGKEVGAVWMPAAAERQPDDLHARRAAVHHRRGRRRHLHERVHRVRAAAERTESEPRSDDHDVS